MNYNQMPREELIAELEAHKAKIDGLVQDKLSQKAEELAALILSIQHDAKQITLENCEAVLKRAELAEREGLIRICGKYVKNPIKPLPWSVTYHSNALREALEGARD